VQLVTLEICEYNPGLLNCVEVIRENISMIFHIRNFGNKLSHVNKQSFYTLTETLNHKVLPMTTPLAVEHIDAQWSSAQT
jgi:hypothetical protein